MTSRMKSSAGSRKVNKRWTDDEIERLPGLVGVHGTDWSAIAEELGGRHTPTSCRIRYGIGVREGQFAATLDPGSYTPLAKVVARAAVHATPEEMWNAAREITSVDVARHREMRFVDVTIDDDRVIGISAISDQHIRQTGPVDLARMESDAKLVQATPGLFALLGGDGVDNHIKHRAAMVHGGTSPKREWEMYDHYLTFFGDRILAMITGNHDDWTSDFAGVSMVEQLAQQKKIHWAHDEIVIHLKLGQQTYHIKIRHQYRYNSSFNQVHTVKRLWEMGQDDFDVGVVCHHHEAAIEPFQKHGRMVWGARPGSYQLTSGHSRRYGYNHTTPTCPTFLFWPDQHKVLGFQDVADAAGYLAYLRRR